MINPPKNWQLKYIIRSVDHCDNCEKPIIWCYYIYQDGLEAVVGSECVKAVSDIKNPTVAKAALVGNWHQKRSYYYKRISGNTWFIGLNKVGKWWVATRPNKDSPWLFAGNQFETIESAKLAIIRHINDT